MFIDFFIDFFIDPFIEAWRGGGHGRRRGLSVDWKCAAVSEEARLG
jgi:hypothetical protein